MKAFNELHEKVIPSVKSFEQDILKYREQNLQHREIIFRFDEIMTTKASKMDLKFMKNELKKNFIDKIEFAEYENKNKQEFENHFDYLVKLEETMDLLNQELNKEIFQAVRRATLPLSKALLIGKRLQEEEDPVVKDQLIRSIMKMLEDRDEIIAMGKIKFKTNIFK